MRQSFEPFWILIGRIQDIVALCFYYTYTSIRKFGKFWTILETRLLGKKLWA